MNSPSQMHETHQEHHTDDVSEDWIDSIERLIRWVAPYTIGRERVLQSLADVRKARRETHRLRDALRLLSRELDALYPPGAVISLARRRVRDVVFG
jgi:hypothetical protein